MRTAFDTSKRRFWRFFSHQRNFQKEFIRLFLWRRVSQNEELVLNVSPAFSTALDGVQFTWALKISDDCAASDYYYEDNASNISVSLYYKDGPTPDVHVVEAKWVHFFIIVEMIYDARWRTSKCAYVKCNQSGRILSRGTLAISFDSHVHCSYFYAILLCVQLEWKKKNNQIFHLNVIILLCKRIRYAHRSAAQISGTFPSKHKNHRMQTASGKY